MPLTTTPPNVGLTTILGPLAGARATAANDQPQLPQAYSASLFTRYGHLGYPGLPGIPGLFPGAFWGLARPAELLKWPATGTTVQQAIEKASQARHQTVTRQDLHTDHAPINNNQATPMMDAAVATDYLFPDIRRAQSSIHIASLEYEPGLFSTALTDLLISKHQAGVKVRLLIDGYGAHQYKASYRTHITRLKNAGIEVLTHNTLDGGLEHRKLFIIDGKQAYTGGWCIRDNSVLSKSLQAQSLPMQATREAGWLPDTTDDQADFHDIMIRLQGESVRQLQTNFCMSWRYHNGNLEPDMSPLQFARTYFPTPSIFLGTATVKVLQGVPGIASDAMDSMLDVMRAATETLDVEVAYLLRRDVISLLSEKARAGVRVRLLVPGDNDHESYDYTLKYHYKELLDAGVEIWHFNGYNHGKIVIADKRYVWIGSGNPEVVFSAPSGIGAKPLAYDTSVVVDDRNVGQNASALISDHDFNEAVSTRITEPPALSLWGRLKQRVYHGFYYML